MAAAMSAATGSGATPTAQVEASPSGGDLGIVRGAGVTPSVTTGRMFGRGRFPGVIEA